MSEPVIRWVVREVPVVGALNSLACLPPLILRFASVHLPEGWSIASAAVIFGLLTALNTASARYHAATPHALAWRLLLLYELLAAIAGVQWLLLPRCT